MNKKRQKLIQAIINHDMIAISYYLDGDVLHSSVSKSVFEAKLEVFFNKIRTSLKTDIQVSWDVDFTDYTEVNHYLEPVLFQIGAGYFLWDIHETESGNYCIDECLAHFVDGDSTKHYCLDMLTQASESLLAHLGRRALIHAISNLNIETVEKFMDKKALHFQSKKNVAVTYLKEFFVWMAKEKGETTIEVVNTKCDTCYDEDDNEVIHDHVVLFQLANGAFAFDIEPTKNGLYKLDYCGSYDKGEKQNEMMYSHFMIRIPYDLLPNFKPDPLYIRLQTEKEKMLSEIDNGHVVFWFVEDLTIWLKKHAWSISKFDNYGYGSFAFTTLINIVRRLGFLRDSLIADKECIKANEEYDQLNHDDIWEVYEWHKKYKNQEFASTYPDLLNLDRLNEGYFTFKEFLPNLRFSVYGHTELLKYIQNLDKAYYKTEAIQKDTVLEDIEDEWFLDEFWNNDLKDDDCKPKEYDETQEDMDDDI